MSDDQSVRAGPVGLAEAAAHLPFRAADVAVIFDAKANSWNTKGERLQTEGHDSPLDAAAIKLNLTGSNVVDLGGGNGRTLAKLAASSSPANLVLVDISRQMIDAATAESLPANAARVVANAVRSPLPSAWADAVILRQVLQHVSRPGALIAEAARLLREGGVVLLQIPGARYLDRWVPFHSHETDSIGRFTEAEVSALLGDSGLHATVSTHQFTFYFTGLIQLLRGLNDIGLLNKLLAYKQGSVELVDALLSTGLVEAILSDVGSDAIRVDAEYIFAIGEKTNA